MGWLMSPFSVMSPLNPRIMQGCNAASHEWKDAGYTRYTIMSIDQSAGLQFTHSYTYVHSRLLRKDVVCHTVFSHQGCDDNTKWQEIKHLRQAFRAAGYPKKVAKGSLRGWHTLSYSPQTSQTPPKLQLLLYIPGLSERIKRACQALGVKTVCRSRSTLRSALVQVKQPSEDRKKNGVVYEALCKNCVCVCTAEKPAGQLRST